MTLVSGQHDSFICIAYNSDAEMLFINGSAPDSRGEAAIRTQRHRLDADKCFQ